MGTNVFSRTIVGAGGRWRVSPFAIAMNLGRPYGWTDIWVARRETVNSPWSKPANLGPKINSLYGGSRPFITGDGSTLYFRSNRPGGIGGWDIWQVQINPILKSYQKNITNIERR